MKKILIILLSCLAILTGCGKTETSENQTTPKEPIFAEVTKDGIINIESTVKVLGETNTHGHSKLTIKPEDKQYEEWLKFLEIKPGENTKFEEWPDFYLKNFEEKDKP